jgi:TonB-dependent receptor-like protein
LPDSLTGFLTATPFSYNTTVPAPYTAVGDRFDEVNIHRNAYNFYFQDAWKISPRLTLNYGLRYEANSRIGEPLHRTSTARFVDAEGKLVPPWEPGAQEIVLMNPQPPYGQDWNGWGPRLSTEWQAARNTVVRAGGAITSILPNLFWMNFLTGGFPFIVNPYLSATAGAPLPFSGGVTAFNLPTLYTTTGQVAVPGGNTRVVPANTNLDMPRFESDLSALTPGRQPQPLAMAGMAPDIRTGYIVSQTASVEQTVKEVVLAASYVGTAGVKLECINSPNGYAGASPEFAHFTQFNSAGQVTGGYGPESFVTTGSHSTYHALQLSASKNNPRLGLGFQTSYTFSKSIDDTSAVVVGYGGPTGTIIQAVPQDPRNPGADKGPSTFDVTQAFTSSVIQVLPLDRVSWLRPLGQRFNSGWQFLNITTLTTGMPFTVYSGIQQTGAGAGGGDRPDQIAVPVFSTSRTIREDYFGRGADDDSFFSVPINISGGTGPNSGRFGSLGRDTFRGPSLHDLDFALIKDTTLSSRGGSEPPTLEFRGEFFNALNLVNFGQPVNVLRGSGFGLINHTAGTSRQIQFSLKLIF